MGWVITTMLFLSAVASARADAPDPTLPSRELDLPLVLVVDVEPVNFDLIDARQDLKAEKPLGPTESPHTFFVVKRHLGASVGYDNTVVHGSVGYYMTVAEWGRWNFGVPSIGIGVGRYPLYDRRLGVPVTKSEPTVFVSVASVHYRVSYLRSLGVNWYLNLEQVYDLRYNMTGSQFGISFSTK